MSITNAEISAKERDIGKRKVQRTFFQKEEQTETVVESYPTTAFKTIYFIIANQKGLLEN